MMEILFMFFAFLVILPWLSIFSTNRAKIILCVAAAQVVAIIYLWCTDGFKWNYYLSTEINIAHNLGSVTGCSFVVGLPAWISVVVCIILGIKKHILLQLKRISEDKDDLKKFFAVALDEIEKNNVDKSCWGEALVESFGNEAYTRSLYVKIRAKKLLKQKKSPSI